MLSVPIRIGVLQSPNSEHHLLAMNVMAAQPSIPLSPYLAMCAGDAHPKVRKAMFGMMMDGTRLRTFNKADAEKIFKAELTAPEPVRRLTAFEAMQVIPQFHNSDVLQACLHDAGSDKKVKKAAQQTLEIVKLQASRSRRGV